MRIAAIVITALCLLANSAFPGQNINLKVAIHLEAHNAKRTCSDRPAIEGCFDIAWFYEGCGDIDVFPVFYDIYGYTAVEYRLVWPVEWGSGIHTHCADLAIGDINQSGDGMAMAWYECQISGYCVPGWLALTAMTPGRITFSPDWEWDIKTADCYFQEDEPQVTSSGGVCGEPGDPPCGTISHFYLDVDDGVDCAAASQEIPYVLIFGNPWSNPPIHEVTLTDELPSQCEFVGATAGGVYDEAGHKVNWEIEALSGGQRDTVGVTALVNAGVEPGEVLDNYCYIVSDDSLFNSYNEKHCRTPICDDVPLVLGMGAAFDGDCLAPEGDIVYELTYGTPGQQADVHNVVLIDTLPTCLEISWATEGHWYEPYEGWIMWDLGTLAPDTQGSVEIGARATWDCNPGGVIRNTCYISSDETDTERASVLTQVCDIGPIGLLKKDDVGAGCIHPGDSIAYTIKYNNLEDEDFHDVVLTDNLHAAVIFISAGGSGEYDAGSHKITWPVGTLPAGSLDSVSAVVKVKEDWIHQYCIENTCRIVSAETEPETAVLRTYLCGTSLEGMAAVHVLPRNANRSCTENFPEIDFCEDICWTEAACEVDVFPVFFGLDEARGFEYGLTWPEEWGSISFTSCSDMTIGALVHPGDGISQTWSECRTDNIIFTGYASLDAAGPGLIEVIPHPENGGPRVVTCHYGSYTTMYTFSGGVCGAEGEEPCPGGPQSVKPVTWGAIKAMFR